MSISNYMRIRADGAWQTVKVLVPRNCSHQETACAECYPQWAAKGDIRHTVYSRERLTADGVPVDGPERTRGSVAVPRAPTTGVPQSDEAVLADMLAVARRRYPQEAEQDEGAALFSLLVDAARACEARLGGGEDVRRRVLDAVRENLDEVGRVVAVVSQWSGYAPPAPQPRRQAGVIASQQTR